MASSAQFVKSESDWLAHTASSAGISDYPFTFAAWVKIAALPSVTDNIVALSQPGSSPNKVHVLDILADGSIEAWSADTGGGGAESTAQISTGSWQHVAGVYTSDTLRAAFLNGGDKGTDANDVDFNAGLISEVWLGRSYDAYSDAKMALVGIWNVALSDSEIAQLAAGADPTTIQGANLVALYFTGTETFEDQQNGYDLSGVAEPSWDSADFPGSGDALTAADLSGGTPAIGTPALDGGSHSLSAADLVGGTSDLGTPTLLTGLAAQENVFGRAGDAATQIDLTSLGYSGPFSVIESAGSIGLDGSTVTVDHTAAIHEYAMLSSGSGNIQIWNSTAPAGTPTYPLSVSGHYIADAGGSTFIFNGDTAWSIVCGGLQADATTYLSGRAAKNVNLIMMHFIEHKFAPNAPENAYGEEPFTAVLGGGEDDFTARNELYWRHVDWVLREAHRYGITALCFPCYLGYHHSDEGWAAEMDANPEASISEYAGFIGARYGGFPNIIWSMGGDENSTYLYNLTAKVNLLGNGIKAVDTAHLMTAHAGREVSALDAYDQNWLDLNSSYSDATVLPNVENDYKETPVKPTFLIEAYYGNEHSMTDLGVRIQAWQALFSGACGHIYGNAPQWYFGEDASHPANGFADTGGLDWHEQLDSFGAPMLEHIGTVLAGVDPADYTPDHEEDVLVSGYGSGLTYCPLMFKADGLVAYMPAGQTVTIDTSGLAPGEYAESWMRASDGATTPDTETVDGNNLDLVPPYSSTDNVLVMEQTSHALGGADLSGGAPALSAPTLGEVQDLVADDVSAGAPALSLPDLAVADVGFSAQGLVSAAAVLGAPAFGQIHVLTAVDLSAGVAVLGLPGSGGYTEQTISESVFTLETTGEAIF